MIQLTNCPCKLLDRMVNRRLQWHLETNDLLHNGQAGFRKYRSTMDCLTTLESEIMETYRQKEYMIAISFNLKKAYDVTWRHYIVLQMLKMGLKGNMVEFTNNFLKNRTTITAMGKTFIKTTNSGNRDCSRSSHEYHWLFNNCKCILKLH